MFMKNELLDNVTQYTDNLHMKWWCHEFQDCTSYLGLNSKEEHHEVYNVCISNDNIDVNEKNQIYLIPLSCNNIIKTI